MDIQQWLTGASVVAAFSCGAAMVYRLSGGARAGARRRPGAAKPVIATPRPEHQIPVRGFATIVADSGTRDLVGSVERRTRFSTANFERDCQPVLQSLAEFVQFLPASESHHHAQPGGLWIHLLEVTDAALTFRAGLEIPPGANTEDRKRLEHRWTFAVFAAALLHDVGKPITDVKVTLFGPNSHAGSDWAPLAGAMPAFGAHWYSVGFGDASERDYKAHSKLAGMLLHSFVQPRVMRWLAEDGDVLGQLLAYLSGEDPDGVLGSIIKRADSDSVRRNLLHGPRTRFATARARPLVERLMEALRRMLIEGGSLPLNRPGAAGWVFDGKVWFVCARLADEVRTYLAQHESITGVPGKDRNDRLFDIWQEFGAVLPAPDGGAVWRVRVECDGWSPPDVLTVLCFPVEHLFADPVNYPAAVKGRVWVPGATGAGGTGALAAPVATVATTAPAQVASAATPISVRPAVPVETFAAVSTSGLPAVAIPVPVAVFKADPPQAISTNRVPLALHAQPETAAVHEPAAAFEVLDPEAPSAVARQAVSHRTTDDDDKLSPQESAVLEPETARRTVTPELGAPLRPHERGQRPAGGTGGIGKGPSPAAAAFMGWVAQAVGTGELKYNEDGSLVHFVAEGALLLSPEIFRRFLAEHDAVPDGPIAALRESHGEGAYRRLQNELAKSGWTTRNADENLHYYAFMKADKSLSRSASFYLIARPQQFWNPVPMANDRIRAAPRPKKLVVPAGGIALNGRAKHSPRSTA